MTYYVCYHEDGSVLARCQTRADVEVLKAMGRPISRVESMKEEESVVCSLTDSPAGFNEDV